MPTEVKWGNPERTFLYYSFAEPWTWDDFYAIVDEGRQMREDCDITEIDVVFDLSRVRSLPQGALTHIGSMGRRETITGSHVRRIILVKANPYVKAIMDMVVRISPRLAQKVYVVADQQAAYDMLAQTGAEPQILS